MRAGWWPNDKQSVSSQSSGKFRGHQSSILSWLILMSMVCFCQRCCLSRQDVRLLVYVENRLCRIVLVPYFDGDQFRTSSCLLQSKNFLSRPSVYLILLVMICINYHWTFLPLLLTVVFFLFGFLMMDFLLTLWQSWAQLI